MPLPKRPRDVAERVKLIMDMATGEVPNDKEQVLEHRRREQHPEGRQRSAKGRAASQTPERRTEIAKKAAAARWAKA